MSAYKESVSYVVWRSFLPTAFLAQRRDIDALWLKFYSRITDLPIPKELQRSSHLWDFGRLSLNSTSESSYEYERLRQLGSIIVEDSASPVQAAHDTHCIPSRSTVATQLHLNYSSGVHAVRADLGSASAYIQQHECLRSRPYVMGVTYSELGKVATRLGFKQMEIETIDIHKLAMIDISHQVFCALNDTERPFEPTVVYLPTEEFIERFSAVSLIDGPPSTSP